MLRRSDPVLAEGRFVYRLVVAFDVEKYSRLDAQRQLATQTDLRGMIDACGIDLGLDPSRWHRQVNGDGELAVLPVDTNIPHVVGSLTRELERRLLTLNNDRPTEQRLRVRLAMHHGTLISGPLGPAGEAPVVVTRLLDAAPLRKFLTLQRERNLAVIVSDSLYNEVICSGFCPLNRSDFEQIRVVVKETPYCGYIYRGMDADPAELSGPEDSPGLTLGRFLNGKGTRGIRARLTSNRPYLMRRTSSRH
jgi:hypothetical protein